MLGIEIDKDLYYEGPGQIGFGIWPSPIVTIATVIDNPSAMEGVPTHLNLGNAKLLFREDFFDPITRIRRGRFFNRDDGAQPMQWRTQPHPAYAEEVGYRQEANGFLVKLLYGFHDWAARAYIGRSNPHTLIALGTTDAMTLWKVIGIERLSSGQDLVTLKSRSNMGVLPEIEEGRIPEAGRHRVMQSLGILIDTAYRAGPESVIDRCRDFVAAALGVFFDALKPGAAHLDLGGLAVIAQDQHKYVVANSARTLALLHARLKPNEQARRDPRVPDEDDAEAALSLTGLVIRELGWDK